jgi:hypothetical protein
MVILAQVIMSYSYSDRDVVLVMLRVCDSLVSSHTYFRGTKSE